MNKSDIIKALCRENVLTKKEAESVVNICFNGMSNALASGDRVEIRGLGAFSVKKYKSYNGRNPKTGEVITVKPKKLPFFKCGKDLKERVNHI
jgi:integration host factor subunit beta